MRNKIKAFLLFVCSIAVCLCFVACDSGLTLTVSGKEKVTINVGQTYIMKATVKNSSSVPQIEWSTSDASVATVEAGTVVGVSGGTAVITVKTGDLSKSVTITVLDNRSYAVNVNGVVQTVAYGKKAAKPADPVKKADAQYTYTFAGWYVGDAEYDFDMPVTSNLVIEARYIETLNKYTVKVGGVEKEYEYGSYIEKPADPTKESTAAADYAFAGWYVPGKEDVRWNFGGDKVTGDTVLEAKFIEIARSYEVKFDGKSARYVKYGEKLEQPEAPVMANTAEYTYVFDGWYDGDKKWDFENDTVAGSLDLVAKFTAEKNSYKVTLGDSSENYEYGQLIAKPLDPKKEKDAQYTYTFDGWYSENGDKWDFENDVVTGDTVLVARYNARIRSYKVVIDGKAAEYDYGTKISRPIAPLKDADDEYTYYFDKFVVKGTETEWDFNNDVVTGELELVAVFKQVKNRYIVSFDDYSFADYAYGDKISKPTNPQKESDEKYDYFFKYWATEDGEEWDFENDTVTENIKLCAKYDRSFRQYVVSFMNGDVVFAESERTMVGDKLAQPTAEPQKQATYKNEFVFAGWYTSNGTKWDFENDVLSGALTLNARFNAVERKYTVSFDGNVTEYVYGAKIVMPEDPVKTSDDEEFNKHSRYEFDGWYVNGNKFVGGNVTEDLTLESQFKVVTKYFAVSFYSDSNNVLYAGKYKYGEEIKPLVYPEKASNARYSYVFEGWTNGNGGDLVDFEGLTATEDVEFYPVFTKTLNKYTVTLKNYDGTIFQSDADMVFEYESQFEYPASANIPLKIVANSEDAYAFVYWSQKPDGEEYTGLVTGNMTLYAVYVIDNNRYDVSFYDYDGNEMTENALTGLKRNEILTLPNMFKAETNATKYEFLGWATVEGGKVVYAADVAIRCNGDMTLYPVYKEITRYYYVSVELTDADANYVLTDVDGNALTADDLVFEYNQVFRFKAAINSESKGSIRILNGVSFLTPDENGVYSVNVREALVRLGISGLTLRRYSITADVTLAKQSTVEWAKIADDESDIIVKLTKNGEVEYIENAIENGRLTINNLTAGTFKVEFVYKNTMGEYKLASNQSFEKTLNADWAVKNGQDETMTWELDALTVGYMPFVESAGYKIIDDVITAEEFWEYQSPTLKYTDCVPGEGDFAVSVSYRQTEAKNNESPSVGFIFGTADGKNVSLFMVNEGSIRILGGNISWANNNVFGSQRLLCKNGAILNKWGDCYTDVSLRYIKKGNYLYIVGDFSRPGSNVVAVNNKLFGVIDVVSGTLYTNVEMNGPSSNPTASGKYQVWQNDLLKSLSNIVTVNAHYGITNVQPVEIFGMNYSVDPDVIDSYANMGSTLLDIKADEHVSYRMSESYDIANKTLAVYKNGTITFATDNGYVFDKITIDGNNYDFELNSDYTVTLKHAVDFTRAGVQNIVVASKKGSYATATGTIVSESGNVANATVKFVGGGKTYQTRTGANGAYSVALISNTYTMSVVADGYFDRSGSIKVTGDLTKDIELVKPLFTLAKDAGGTVLYENVKHGLDDEFTATDVTYTLGDNTGVSVTGFKSDKFIGDGQYFVYTLRYNNESNGFKTHGTKVYGDKQWGDSYMKSNIGGQSFWFNSSGCTCSDGNTGKQPFDFAMDRDLYQNNPITVAAYDFALTKEGDVVKMYAKYNGTTDWVHVYTKTITDKTFGFDEYLITTWGGYAYNYSLTGLKLGDDVKDITDHVWDYTRAWSGYASSGRTTLEDGSHVYNLHANISGDGVSNAQVVPVDVYDAKNNVVTVSADYSIKSNGNWWSLAGWLFQSDDRHRIGIFLRSEATNGNYFFITTAGGGNGYNNRHAYVKTANENNGLYVCNPDALTKLNNNYVRFSAKWVINGYRWKLYIGEYGKEANTLILDMDYKTYTSKVKVTKEGNSDEALTNKLWGGSDAASADKKYPDMSKLQIGIQYCNDEGNNSANKNLIYAERFTVKENWTGGGINLTGPAYKLYNDENAQPVVSNTWYAEADFSGCVTGSGWAGFITDMRGNETLDVSSGGAKNSFYSVGYGYGSVFTHDDKSWMEGISRGNSKVAVSGSIKLGVARMGKTYYVFLNGNHIKTFEMGTDAASAMGVYCGTGEVNSVSIKNFTVDFEFDQTKLDAMLKGEAVTVKINGTDRVLNRANMGGSYTVGNTKHYSFSRNYTLSGRDSGKITNITYIMAENVTGSTYYFETTFSNASGWKGIICNAFDCFDNEQNTEKWYGAGVGFGQIYLNDGAQKPWQGSGKSVKGGISLSGEYRFGVARIDNAYYVYINGELIYSWTQDGLDGAEKDNVSGVGIFAAQDGGFEDMRFWNSLYTTDAEVVKAIVQVSKKY